MEWAKVERLVSKMGSTQIKCECGKPSTIETIVEYESGEILIPFRGFEHMKKLTGYAAWSYRIDKYIAYTCEPCGDKIADRLDKHNEIGYEMNINPKGFYRTELP